MNPATQLEQARQEAQRRYDKMIAEAKRIKRRRRKLGQNGFASGGMAIPKGKRR